jgi:hypothetical protein
MNELEIEKNQRGIVQATMALAAKGVKLESEAF